MVCLGGLLGFEGVWGLGPAFWCRLPGFGQLGFFRGLFESSSSWGSLQPESLNPTLVLGSLRELGA